MIIARHAEHSGVPNVPGGVLSLRVARIPVTDAGRMSKRRWDREGHLETTRAGALVDPLGFHRQ